MTNKRFLLFIFFFLLLGNTNSNIQQESADLVDFQSIRELLKKDQLIDEAETKVQQKKEVSREREELIRRRYNFPTEHDFWSIFSEWWLVNNLSILNWDFMKPDYGIGPAFKRFLEQRGHHDTKFKILLLNTPNITHFYLPAGPGEKIFLLSVPFIRTLDLSLQEISLLLYQDFLRSESQFFEKKVMTEELQSLFGRNFQNKKLPTDLLQKVSRSFDRVILEDGYTFQEQFEVTKKMDQILRAHSDIWNAYFELIKKIDTLTKTNFLYFRYPQIYPSPELQMGWLRPSKSQRF